jgi:hypothetical protein
MDAKRNYKLLLLVPTLLVIGISASSCPTPASHDRSEYNKVHPLYTYALNSAGNGYGYDTLNMGAKKHYPMAHALITSAESNRHMYSNDKTALQTAIQHADWLVNNKETNENSIIGWGLPERWDAFGDGSENPAHTEYTITTALVIQGLLDTIDAMNESAAYHDKKEIYRETVQEAFDSFIENSFYTENADGTIVFWYSSQPQDSYPVINVHAMFIGVLQRMSNYPVREDKRSIYQGLANKGTLYLLNSKKEENNTWYWNYYGESMPPHIKEPRENDLVHANYTADGLLIYKNHGGHLAAEIDEERILNGLRLFIKNGQIQEMFSQLHCLRSWGLGYFLYVICEYYPQETEIKNLIYQHILARVGDDGFTFTDDKNSPSNLVRHNAHILMGLSKYFWNDD